jgi:NCS1 nucleoside transporter family
MVGFWATMSLSIADITRYTKTQRAQVRGQFLGLPGTMMLYSFVGIFVTCAAVVNFKDILVAEDAPWDPVTLISRFDNPWVVIFAQTGMIIATLSTNIAANVIAPANAISNLAPKAISFKTGGTITGLIGIVMCPWWLMDDISPALVFVSGLLGPVLGIMIADYFVVRKMELQLAELFKVRGAYTYSGGFNWVAMGAMVAGMATALVGFFVPALEFLYKLSWFSGFAVAFVIYVAGMRKR